MEVWQDVLGMGSEALIEEARRSLPSGAGLAGRIYARVFEKGSFEPEAFGMSARSAQAWRKGFGIGLLEVRGLAEEEGELGPTSKAIMECGDGARVECVRIPMHGGKSTLCISSQVGCRMACAFCETGRSGLSRNLLAAEIVAQVHTARFALGWDCGNIVFMGMGEPLDNLDQVSAALRVLTDRRGFSYSWERITVCSSGPPGGIAGLRALGLRRLNLSISLNAGDDATRDALMPVNHSQGLSALASEASDYSQRGNFVLAINYCLIPGVNDGRNQAKGVADFCARVGRTMVNLIPYNPGSHPIARAPSPEELGSFASWLREEGLELRHRAAKGSSIMAACGQLGR